MKHTKPNFDKAALHKLVVPKQEKPPMSRTSSDITGNFLDVAFGLPVMSLEVKRQSLEVSQVLTLFCFIAWARQAYTYSCLEYC
jgi:hypothetical protein